MRQMGLSWLVGGRRPWSWHWPWVRTSQGHSARRPHNLKSINQHPERTHEKENRGWERMWVVIRISVPPLDDSSHFQQSSYRINIFSSDLHNILRMVNFILGFRSPMRSHRICCAKRQWVTSGVELVTKGPMQPHDAAPTQGHTLQGVLAGMPQLWFGYQLIIKFDGVHRTVFLLLLCSLVAKSSIDFRERDKPSSPNQCFQTLIPNNQMLNVLLYIFILLF